MARRETSGSGRACVVRIPNSDDLETLFHGSRSCGARTHEKRMYDEFRNARAFVFSKSVLAFVGRRRKVETRFLATRGRQKGGKKTTDRPQQSLSATTDGRESKTTLPPPLIRQVRINIPPVVSNFGLSLSLLFVEYENRMAQSQSAWGLVYSL